MLRAHNGLAVRCSGFGLSVSGLSVGAQSVLEASHKEDLDSPLSSNSRSPQMSTASPHYPLSKLTLTLGVPVNLSEHLGYHPCEPNVC